MANFPLQKLIEVRQLRLQAAERVVAEKRAQLVERETSLKQHNATITRTKDECTTIGNSRINATLVEPAAIALTTMQLRIELLQDQLAKLEEERQQLLKAIDTAQQELAAAVREYHRVETKCRALDKQLNHWQHQQQLSACLAEDLAAEELRSGGQSIAGTTI